jgi:hypothetical protein
LVAVLKSILDNKRYGCQLLEGLNYGRRGVS